MLRRGTFHDVVVTALENDGWTITRDPYRIEFGNQELQIDLGAEMPIGAERGGEKIAVEIKSFLSASPVTDLYGAFGQYALYRDLLSQSEPERVIYLAMPRDSYRTLFTSEAGRGFRERNRIRLILYRLDSGGGLEWIE